MNFNCCSRHHFENQKGSDDVVFFLSFWCVWVISWVAFVVVVSNQFVDDSLLIKSSACICFLVVRIITYKRWRWWSRWRIFGIWLDHSFKFNVRENIKKKGADVAERQQRRDAERESLSEEKAIKENKRRFGNCFFDYFVSVIRILLATRCRCHYDMIPRYPIDCVQQSCTQRPHRVYTLGGN